MKGIRPLLMGTAAAVLLVVFVGCQAVFTFSPMGFLQRDPSKLPLAQKMTYAENALASGDEQAMLDAYNAIKNDASGSSDGDLNLLAAKLAMELSGVPDLINEVLAGDIDFSGDPGQDAIYTALLASLNSSYLSDASGFYQDANTNGGNLSSTDYLLGAASILFEGAPANDVDASTTAGTASTFLQDGIDALAPGDPARDILEGFQTFVDGIPYGW